MHQLQIQGLMSPFANFVMTPGYVSWQPDVKYFVRSSILPDNSTPELLYGIGIAN